MAVTARIVVEGFLFRIAYHNDLQVGEANGTLFVLATVVLVLLSFVRRLGIQAEAAVKCVDFVLTYAVLTQGFVAFKTDVEIFADELTPTLTTVMHVRYFVCREGVSELL